MKVGAKKSYIYNLLVDSIYIYNCLYNFFKGTNRKQCVIITYILRERKKLIFIAGCYHLEKFEIPINLKQNIEFGYSNYKQV